MKTPVLIPAFNEVETLPSLLRSLQNQTIEVELVVIDNASSDGTADIAESLGATVLIENTPGQFPALQKGLGHVGLQDLILITDADTIVPPKWTETMMRYQNGASEPTLFTGNIDFIYPNTVTGQLIRHSRHLYRAARQKSREIKGLESRVFGPNMALANLTPDIYNELLTYPAFRRGNDLYIGHAFLTHGGRVKYVKDDEAKVESSGDRYPTLASALRYVTNRGGSAYPDWESRLPGAVDFTVAQYDKRI